VVVALRASGGAPGFARGSLPSRPA
jgi:hypothetical protein